jgi:NADH-quinone oxidoreductase subunit E/NADP-reducing hydrogenase subunit HndA
MTTATAETAKFEELKSYIDEVKSVPGPLMPIMQKAQEIFGYLPIEVQDFIAEELGISMVDVYGVATFYSQFAIEKKGESIVGCCMGTACYVRGSEGVLEALKKQLGVSVGSTTEDGKFTLEATRCLGCCGLAPVMMIGDQVFGRLTADDIPGIIKNFKS